MNKFLLKLICLFLLNTYVLAIKEIKALVPYYYLPTNKNLEKEALNIGKNAYQLLYFGQIKDGLKLAKLAVKVNKYDVNLWLILSEAQIANEYDEDALISLKKAEKLNQFERNIFCKKYNLLKEITIKRSNDFFKFRFKNHSKKSQSIISIREYIYDAKRLFFSN